MITSIIMIKFVNSLNFSKISYRFVRLHECDQIVRWWTRDSSAATSTVVFDNAKRVVSASATLVWSNEVWNPAEDGKPGFHILCCRPAAKQGDSARRKEKAVARIFLVATSRSRQFANSKGDAKRQFVEGDLEIGQKIWNHGKCWARTDLSQPRTSQLMSQPRIPVQKT